MVSMDHHDVAWKLNRRSVAIHRSRRIDELNTAEPRRGSVSLFTGPRPVEFDTLTIRGTLSRAWLEHKARAAAQAELVTLDGELTEPATGDTDQTDGSDDGDAHQSAMQSGVRTPESP